MNLPSLCISQLAHPVTLTSDVKQRSQHNRPNANNSYKTKKNFTGFYTEINSQNCLVFDCRAFSPFEIVTGGLTNGNAILWYTQAGTQAR